MPINYPEEMILLLIMALGKSFELKSGQLVLMVVPRALITGRHGVARHFTVAPPTSLLQPIRTSKTKIVGLPSDRFIDVPLVLASHAPLGQALHSLNNQSKKNNSKSNPNPKLSFYHPRKEALSQERQQRSSCSGTYLHPTSMVSIYPPRLRSGSEISISLQNWNLRSSTPPLSPKANPAFDFILSSCWQCLFAI